MPILFISHTVKVCSVHLYNLCLALAFFVFCTVHVMSEKLVGRLSFILPQSGGLVLIVS